MIRRRLALALSAALALTLAACSASGGAGSDASDTTKAQGTATTEAATTTEATTTTTSAPPNSDLFRNTEAGYQLSISNDWEEGDSQGRADQLWYVADADASFRPNVNVLLQPTNGKDLDFYLDGTTSSLSSALDSPTVVRAKHTTDPDGTERDVFEYTGSTQGLDLHFFATTIISGDNFVLATFSSTADRYDELAPDVEDLLLTLTPI